VHFAQSALEYDASSHRFWFANNTTAQGDVLRQSHAVADKQFASGAPICRCNDRMASCRVAVRQSQQTCDPRARRPLSTCPGRARRSCETQLSSSVKRSDRLRPARMKLSLSNRNRDHQMICGRRHNDTASSEADWQPRPLASLEAAPSSAQPRGQNEDALSSPTQEVRNSERDRPMPKEQSMPKQRCRTKFDD
jgi:hypothetical protein